MTATIADDEINQLLRLSRAIGAKGNVFGQRQIESLCDKLSTTCATDVTKELGPDGKEWAKTEAGYKHVESVAHQSIDCMGGKAWRGHALREAFVAGAEWQEGRGS